MNEVLKINISLDHNLKPIPLVFIVLYLFHKNLKKIIFFNYKLNPGVFIALNIFQQNMEKIINPFQELILSQNMLFIKNNSFKWLFIHMK